MGMPRGFTLFELLIVIAVIGIVSTVALPAYEGYIETANMTKTTAHFQEAIKIAQGTYKKDQARIPFGLPTIAPVDTQGWIDLLSSDIGTAPGGGPAFIESTNNKNTGRGDRETGAIGVRYQAAKAPKKKKNDLMTQGNEARLDLWRPLYFDLREQRARITRYSVEVTNQRKPE